MSNQLTTIKKNGLALQSILDAPATIRTIEDFTKRLNQPPPKEGIEKTPDGKAETLTISHVEGKLDEIYLRQWGTSDVSIQVIANEIAVWLTLWVIDPSTGVKITRAGFAAVQITVDAAPDDIKNNKQLKNQWALNLENKKPNACYLSFPKAKSLAIKNAAQSLGVIFGRNLNRKIEDTPEDYYSQELDAKEAIDLIGEEIQQCETIEALTEIWNQHSDLHANLHFKKHFTLARQKFNLKK